MNTDKQKFGNQAGYFFVYSYMKERKVSLLLRFALSFSILLLLSCTKKPDFINPVVHADTLVTVRDTTLRYYLALGDSYTIGQSVPATDRFPVQVVNKMRAAGYKMAEADIIATSGWTTADLWNAIQIQSPEDRYDFVSLLIGVNNQYQGQSISLYRTEFTALLKKSIKLAGNRTERVFVLSIPDYSVTPFASTSDRAKIAREIDSFNALNKELADANKVNYLNITPESRKAATDPSLIAIDGLHFSGKEYGIWAAPLTEMMKEVIK